MLSRGLYYDRSSSPAGAGLVRNAIMMGSGTIKGAQSRSAPFGSRPPFLSVRFNPAGCLSLSVGC